MGAVDEGLQQRESTVDEREVQLNKQQQQLSDREKELTERVTTNSFLLDPAVSQNGESVTEVLSTFRGFGEINLLLHAFTLTGTYELEGPSLNISEDFAIEFPESEHSIGLQFFVTNDFQLHAGVTRGLKPGYERALQRQPIYQGMIDGINIHAFAVPEPSALLLLLVALPFVRMK